MLGSNYIYIYIYIYVYMCIYIYIDGWVQEGPKYKIAVVEESENKNSICNIKSGSGQMVL